MRTHTYTTRVSWTGNRGAGTASYTGYDRAHEITAAGKPVIPASADPSFRGDPTRYNPEELLVASLSSCHMLWYLHLCASAGISVVSYEDDARGTMEESTDGGGRFQEVTLRPRVVIDPHTDELRSRAIALHDDAHHRCFIASSVNFEVRCNPEVIAHT